MMTTSLQWQQNPSETDFTTNTPGQLAHTSADVESSRPIWSPWKISSKAKSIYFTADFLYTYFGGFLFVFGIIGNILSIIIFYRKRLRSVQVTIFLRALAFTDLLLIVIGLGLNPKGPAKFKFVDNSTWVCKVYLYVKAVLRSLSIWLVVGFNIERFVAITMPLKLKAQQALGSRFIYGSILSFLFIRMCYDINILIVFDVVPTTRNPRVTTCDPVYDRSPFFIGYIRPWFSIILNTVIPFIIILICNIFIILELRRSAKFQVKQATTGSHESGKPDQGSGGNKGQGQRQQSIMVMLLTVSIMFLLLSCPMGIAMFLTRLYPPSFWWGSADMAALGTFMWTMASITMYLNSAINFILYIASGSSFRKEMVNILREIWIKCGGRSKAGSETSGNENSVSNNRGCLDEVNSACDDTAVSSF